MCGSWFLGRGIRICGDIKLCMEQIIDVFDIDWKMVVVQVVNFTLVLGVLWYVFYKPLTMLVEKRRAQIIKGVADAEGVAVALQDVDAKRGEIVTQATIEAERILVTAQEQGKQKEAEMLKEAQVQCERILAEARVKAEEIQCEVSCTSVRDI